MNYLDKLENNTIFIIREAYARFNSIAMLWSMGKDSTALLWLVRKAFFGQVPFPVVHIDTGYKFDEIYDFRDRISEDWGLNLIIQKNQDALSKDMSPEKGKFVCCNALKTEALKYAIKKYGFEGLLLAIRRDEHGIRAKERHFSPRDSDFVWDYRSQPPELWDFFRTEKELGGHLRIHPMLEWREIDVWRYIQREKIPVIPLYFAKNHFRFRSIGCKTCCAPVKSDADTIKKVIKELEKTSIDERSGRAQDKEDAYTMQKLRSLGYM